MSMPGLFVKGEFQNETCKVKPGVVILMSTSGNVNWIVSGSRDERREMLSSFHSPAWSVLDRRPCYVADGAFRVPSLVQWNECWVAHSLLNLWRRGDEKPCLSAWISSNITRCSFLIENWILDKEWGTLCTSYSEGVFLLMPLKEYIWAAKHKCIAYSLSKIDLYEYLFLYLIGYLPIFNLKFFSLSSQEMFRCCFAFPFLDVSQSGLKA